VTFEAEKTPGLWSGATRESSENQQSGGNAIDLPARASLQDYPRPLRSFKVEHAEFCRYVISPRWRHRRLTAVELDERRRVAAWRTIRAALRRYPVEVVIDLARDMSTAWYRCCLLPNCPPGFAFDEKDAVRMALEAAELRE
jgi:hypothetical protein